LYMEVDVKRGDVYMVDFGSPNGSVQGGMRPAVVLQNDKGNLYSPTVTVAPITSKQKRARMPTHVKLSRGDGGLAMESTVLAEQMRTINKTQIVYRLGSLSMESTSRLVCAVKIQLAI